MSSEQEKPIRTFIYGSCVSRDTFDYLPAERVALRGYVARSSLVSAMSEPTSSPVSDWLDASPFQRRQIEGDAASILPSEIAKTGADLDLLLWDLVDERLGYFRGADGGVITKSVDLMRTTNQTREAPLFSYTAFGSDRHYAEFAEALTRWGELLDSKKLIDRTILLAPSWAEYAVDGTPTPPSFGTLAGQANSIFGRYVELVRRVLGLTVATRSTTYADPRHKWGLAPFHYERPVYEHLATQVMAHVDHVRPTRANRIL